MESVYSLCINAMNTLHTPLAKFSQLFSIALRLFVERMNVEDRNNAQIFLI